MAYATANPPIQSGGGVGGAPTIWVYSSADAHTDVDATDYFSNGADLGLKEDDLMFVIDTATPTATMHQVASSTTITAATLA